MKICLWKKNQGIILNNGSMVKESEESEESDIMKNSNIS